jgi:hypothetical protein
MGASRCSISIDTFGHVYTKISKVLTHAENPMADVIVGSNNFGEAGTLDSIKTLLHKLLF